MRLAALLLSICIALSACQIEETTPVTLEIQELNPTETAQRAKEILTGTPVQVADGLELSLWAIDELAPRPHCPGDR